MLGGLEQKIMEVLWTAENPLKPAEVQKGIKDKYAYTTIMTVLKRMADKKLLFRKLSGNTYVYSPKFSKIDFVSTALSDLYERIFCAYGDLAIPVFKSTASRLGFKV